TGRDQRRQLVATVQVDVGGRDDRQQIVQCLDVDGSDQIRAARSAPSREPSGARQCPEPTDGPTSVGSYLTDGAPASSPLVVAHVGHDGDAEDGGARRAAVASERVFRLMLVRMCFRMY